MANVTAAMVKELRDTTGAGMLDCKKALEAAAGQQLDLPITAQVAAMETALLDAGHGDEDVSALARWFQFPAARRPRD